MPVYLNNAATSYPKPVSVLAAVNTILQKCPYDATRTGFLPEGTDVISECRDAVAGLFNVHDRNRIFFSSGATESLNLVLRGMALQGKHVVTTAIEHNSVLRPLKTMERDGVMDLSIVPCDADGSVSPDAVTDAIGDSTAVVVVNHCSNVTGTVTDLKKIGRYTRDNDVVFIVDGSQSAGTYPIDVQEMNIDVLAFTGHKSLYGIQGIGGAYIREGINVRPLKVGGTGSRSDYLYQPEAVPLLYEAGTMNMAGIASLNAGITHLAEGRLAGMRRKKEMIAGNLKERLEQHSAIRTYPGREYKTPVSLFSFTVDGLEPEDIGYMLEYSFGIITRTGLHCAPLIHRYLGTSPLGSVRVSPSSLTTDGECESFMRAVGTIIAKAGR